jgi:hypothetical protein
VAKINETLTKVISDAIENALSDLHTCLPGRIESYDEATGLAKVVPLLRRKYVKESAAVELPVISGVPVIFPRAGASWIKLPIKSGDYVLLVFAERSLDLWIERGGSIDPEDSAKFSLNDAVAIPGIYPKPSVMDPKGASTSLEITNGSAFIEITEAGKVTMNSGSGLKSGVVTGACICAFTGGPHPDKSSVVEASK